MKLGRKKSLEMLKSAIEMNYSTEVKYALALSSLGLKDLNLEDVAELFHNDKNKTTEEMQW